MDPVMNFVDYNVNVTGVVVFRKDVYIKKVLRGEDFLLFFNSS